MNFTLLDWSAIVGYLAITLILGLYFRKRSGKSVDDYFVSGRKVSWWLAGTSMVATTFAADTPLVVTGLVYRQGIAGNWLWWCFLPSGMMTVFLFARLWRRSGLLTDVQFAEMRYSGKPAAFLRGFRAHLSWVADELPDSRMGHQGDDQHCRHHAGRQRNQRTMDLRFLPHSIHRALRRAGRIVGRAVDRLIPVRAQDGDRDRRGLVCLSAALAECT